MKTEKGSLRYFNVYDEVLEESCTPEQVNNAYDHTWVHAKRKGKLKSRVCLQGQYQRVKDLDETWDFLESESGDMIVADSPMANLSQGCIMWVPCGYLAFMTSQEPTGGIVVSLPHLSSELAKTMDADTWRLVSTSIQAHLDKKSDQSPWKKIIPEFESWVEKAQPTPPTSQSFVG